MNMNKALLIALIIIVVGAVGYFIMNGRCYLHECGYISAQFRDKRV